ncbi:hypothetical protein ACOMHN_059395 [Nucella lapillus]
MVEGMWHVAFVALEGTVWVTVGWLLLSVLWTSHRGGGQAAVSSARPCDLVLHTQHAAMSVGNKDYL